MIAQMRAAGMPEIGTADLQINTSRPVRYGPKKRGWYRIHEYQGRTGRTFYVGAFGCWGRIDTQKIEPDTSDLDTAERERMRLAMRLSAEREAARRAREVQRAADNAADTWREAAVAGESPYLTRKQVPIGGGWVRFLGPNLVVPMVRYDLPAGERLRGVQIIRPDGEKRFTSGMDKAGCAAALGHHKVRDPILIAEGIATAASCWLALGKRYRAIAAFDTNGLLPAARIVRQLHPDARLLFCADDDFLTDGNPGRTKARAAASELGRAGVVFPIFRGRGDRKLTDFNDLHCEEGLDEVAAQLTSAIKWLPRI